MLVLRVMGLACVAEISARDDASEIRSRLRRLKQNLMTFALVGVVATTASALALSYAPISLRAAVKRTTTTVLSSADAEESHEVPLREGAARAVTAARAAAPVAPARPAVVARRAVIVAVVIVIG